MSVPKRSGLNPVKRTGAFRAAYKRGRSKANGLFVVFMARNGTDKHRLGLSVNKKVGNSVTRNHVRRLIKENARISSFFSTRSDCCVGVDVVVVPRPAAAFADFETVRTSLFPLIYALYKKL